MIDLLWADAARPGEATDLVEQARRLVEWAREKGTLGEWSLLYNTELLLLELACAAPLEDTRWSRFAFDVECRLGQLEAEDPTLAERGLVLDVADGSQPWLYTLVPVLLGAATTLRVSDARSSVDP